LFVADPDIGTRDGDVRNTNVSRVVHHPPTNPMIRYPFPVEGGRIVGTLWLPKYLSRADADRLGEFVKTLVIP
jgi:hypothetical protein